MNRRTGNRRTGNRRTGDSRRHPARKAPRDRTALAPALLALVLVACSTTPPSDFYLIGTRAVEGGVAEGHAPVRLGVGPIRLPGYLHGREIATRTGEGQIIYDSYVRWAEPLDTRLAAVLAENLSAGGAVDVLVHPWLGTAIDMQLVVDVVAFEVVNDAEGGRFVLTARWVLLDQRHGKELHRARFSAVEAVDPADHAARTAAGTDLLASFAEAIAIVGRSYAREVVIADDGSAP